MTTGITDHVWELTDIIDLIPEPEPEPEPKKRSPYKK